MGSVTTRRGRGGPGGGRLRLRLGAAAAIAVVLALGGQTLASAQTIDPSALSSLLSQAAPTGKAPSGQVQRIDLGSHGATVTLEGGRKIQLDFSGMAGVGGGPNYLGWAMLAIGMSVVTRLLSAVARITRPFGGRRRRRGDYYD